MNQILVSEKIYVTPELKKKKKIYKIDFFVSVFLVCILFSYYIYAEYDKSKSEAVSREILSNINFEENLVDDTTIKFTQDNIVVILNTEDPFEVIVSEPVPEPEIEEETPINRTIYRTQSGQEYYTVATINIPSINCHYPILNITTDELLKISPTRFWGPEEDKGYDDANEVGNFCIVGHNYRNSKFFSKAINLVSGDKIELTDVKEGRTIEYVVYDKYVVDPSDVSCTSQRTNGLKEITIITCTNDSKKRVIIKARENI